MFFKGDPCPKCNLEQLPKINKESKATARACANCGYIDYIGGNEHERNLANTKRS